MKINIRPKTFKGKAFMLLPMFHRLYERLKGEYIPQYSTPIDVLGMIVAIARSNRSHVLQHLSYSHTYDQPALQSQCLSNTPSPWMANFGIRLHTVDPSSTPCPTRSSTSDSRGECKYGEVPIQEADLILL